MGFRVDIVADSVNAYGQRLTTLEASYPRIVHSEIMTHRDRERNAASSRAIDWPVMMAKVTDDPFVPLMWGAAKKTMQTGGAIPPHLAALADKLWAMHREVSIQFADLIHNIGSTHAGLVGGFTPIINYLQQFGMNVDEYRNNGQPVDTEVQVHKSLPNRLVEPHSFITVVMTATEWKNFFRLRCHEDAEIHFQKIAGMMQNALDASTPKELRFGKWHLPYIDAQTQIEIRGWYREEYQKICPDSTEAPLTVEEIERRVSASRCARVSFTNQGNKKPIPSELGMFERLVGGSGFGHWSPHGHVGMSSTPDTRSGPFRGFIQYRKLFANENADAA